jgi:hypothetical protein
MHIGQVIRLGLSLAVLSLAAQPAAAGVYQGPGYYVAVASSYVFRVPENRSAAFRSGRYHGPIEGPFITQAACEARVTELDAIQETRDPLDGSALFMCYLLKAPMADDSGVWWNPRRDE